MSNLKTKLFYSVERSDGKRFELAAQGNSTLQFGADGTPSLVPSVAAASLAGIDLTEVFTLDATPTPTTGDTGSFRLDGDHTARFVPGVKFTVSDVSDPGDTDNEGVVFEVQGSSYDVTATGKTDIVVKGGATYPDVVAAAAGDKLYIMDLLIKPPAGQVVRVGAANLRTKTVDTAGDDANVRLVAYTQSGAGAPAAAGNPVTDASGTITAGTADTINNIAISSTQILVTNDKPLYLLRTAEDTGTTFTADLLLDGQSI